MRGVCFMKKTIILVMCFALVLLCGLTACEQNTKPAVDFTTSIFTTEQAYAYAADLGYQGTLEEFVAMLSGKDGKDGINGVDGKDGKDGVGIASLTISADGHLLVTLMNDTVIDCGAIPTVKGEKGDTGEQGEQGNGIVSMEKTSSTCYNDVYSVIFTDGKTTTIEVDNNGSGHVYGEWTTILEATCAIYGLRVHLCTVCGASDFDIVEKLSHTYGEWDITQEPTCTEPGVEQRVCTECGAQETRSIDALGHNIEYHAEKEETCETVGNDEYWYCSRCEKYFSDEGSETETDYEVVTHDALGHNFEDGICTQCGALLFVLDSSVVVGDYITLGEYPQADVTENMGEMLSTLYIDSLPTQQDKGEWEEYEYYAVSQMYYRDVLHTDGNRYRAVYFTAYRNPDDNNQQNNGYVPNTVYWFQFEPIRWKVLALSTEAAILQTEMNLDMEVFNVGTDNNYKDSQVRAWLNNSFYDTVFAGRYQYLIEEVEITEEDNIFSDNVWLLSIDEKRQYYNGGTRKYNTAYSKCMGIFDNNGRCGWWTRTTNGSAETWHIGYAGDEYSLNKNLGTGVAPVIKIIIRPV